MAACIVAGLRLFSSYLQFCPNIDQFTDDSPPPVPAGEPGRYPVPVPGQWVEMHHRPDLRSPLVNLVAYDKDGAALKTVSAWDTLLAGIAQRITDTLILLGADRMQADLANTHYIEFLAHQGTEDAAEVHAVLQDLYPTGRTGGQPSA